MYKVKFTNPDTGKGFIDGYKTAHAAKAAVERVNSHRLNRDGKIMRAEYLGRDYPPKCPSLLTFCGCVGECQ